MVQWYDMHLLLAAHQRRATGPGPLPSDACQVQPSDEWTLRFGRAMQRYVYIAHHWVTQLPLEWAASAPLSSMAQTLRRTLNAASTMLVTRSYATSVAR